MKRNEVKTQKHFCAIALSMVKNISFWEINYSSQIASNFESIHELEMVMKHLHWFVAFCP